MSDILTLSFPTKLPARITEKAERSDFCNVLLLLLDVPGVEEENIKGISVAIKF